MSLARELGVSLNCVDDPALAENAQETVIYSRFDTRTSETLRAMYVAMYRSLTSRRTVGLFFRPGSCFTKGSLKSIARRILFKKISHLKDVSILSLVPFSVHPELEQVATNWIYDPQLWDLQYLKMYPSEEPCNLEREIDRQARGRRVIVALGAQNSLKGFEIMTDLWIRSKVIRNSFLMVAGGQVANQSQSAAVGFEASGGLLINRHLEDSEMLAMYRRADMVWCCYDRSYDQSSGIHGRAVQLGIPVIVREGSYIQLLGRTLPHPTLSIDERDLAVAEKKIESWKPPRVGVDDRAALVHRLRSHSISTLAAAMGIQWRSEW